jgi:hypothetical protein
MRHFASGSMSLAWLQFRLAIAEPLKLVALFVIGDGHFVAGVVVMICAYAGDLFVTDRLFVAVCPKLLTLSWFAVSWRLFVAARNSALTRPSADKWRTFTASCGNPVVLSCSAALPGGAPLCVSSCPQGPTAGDRREDQPHSRARRSQTGSSRSAGGRRRCRKAGNGRSGCANSATACSRRPTAPQRCTC